MFSQHPSAYQTPIPADAFSQPLWMADPSVYIVTWVPLGSSLVSPLAGLLSGMNGSILPDLCPRNFLKFLIIPSRQCLDLVSGLNKTRDLRGSALSFLVSLRGVGHKLCLCGVSLYEFHLSLIRPSSSAAFSLQFFTPGTLRTVKIGTGIVPIPAWFLTDGIAIGRWPVRGCAWADRKDWVIQ